MADTNLELERIKADLLALVKLVGQGNMALGEQAIALGRQVDDVATGVSVIQRATETDPKDGVARKALGQVPALTKSMGDVASGLKRVVLLRDQKASDQDVAAEALRITGSCLEIAATAALIAPPPYGKIAAQIISAIQGLVTFVATILDLAHPAKKEPSVAEVVENVVRSVEGYTQRNLLNGVIAELNHMHAGLVELHRQKVEVPRLRSFATWPGIWDLVELPAGEGVDVRIDAMPSWLMDERNLDLKPDPWGEVFYLYLLAKGQYLRNWLSAMLLLDQRDAKDSTPDQGFLVNGDYLLAAAQLRSHVKSQQLILQELTPFAVRKAVGVIIGGDQEVLSSPNGFAPEGHKWPFIFLQRVPPRFRIGRTARATKLAAGTERRVWVLAEEALYFYALDDTANEKDFSWYPPDNVAVPHMQDISVVQSGPRCSEVHFLAQAPELLVNLYGWDEGKVGNRQPYDTSFFSKMQEKPQRYRYLNYGGQDFAQIAATPAGYLCLLTSDAKLWYWDATPAPGNPRREIPAPPIKAAAGNIKIASGSERVYVFGGQEIWHKQHADIARNANTEWQKLAPPRKAPEGKDMPAGWSYKSVAESEGGAVLANLALPDGSTRFYLAHDGEWQVGSADARFCEMLITLPPVSHATFNALKSKVDELVLHQTAAS